ncbi:hypothetical protein VTH82DRAFT_7755 [Thermothelomyces myriococcoides]
MVSITISCHCDAARQTLSARRGSQERGVFSGVSFCHCDACRHTTGLLCTSYAPISPPPLPAATTTTAGLEAYPLSPTTTIYFCSTCGCHVFRARRPSASTAGPGRPGSGEPEWEVATGTITHVSEEAAEAGGEVPNLPEQWHHRHVQDTKDGGLAVWLPPGLSPPSDGKEEYPEEGGAGTVEEEEKGKDDDDDVLPAACHCGSISLLIMRPEPRESPLNPDSGYPDLLLPYVSTPAEVVANPARERWYLRPPPPREEEKKKKKEEEEEEEEEDDDNAGSARARYLAGTCACPSCRLTSGFEVQTWAFIPRRNILIHHRQTPSSSSSPQPPSSPSLSLPSAGQGSKIRKGSKENDRVAVPLDFGALPPGTPLRQYESSPGRMQAAHGQKVG